MIDFYHGSILKLEVDAPAINIAINTVGIKR